MVQSLTATGLSAKVTADASRGIVLCQEPDGTRVVAATPLRWGWPITRYVLNHVVAKATAEAASKILVFVSGLVSKDAVEQAESLGITLIFPTRGDLS